MHVRNMLQGESYAEKYMIGEAITSMNGMLH